MGITQVIKVSLQSILSNKMRSFLTTLGIIIGVAAVIGLVSVVDSVTAMITDTLKTMGTNSITVMITGKNTTKQLDTNTMINFIDSHPELYDAVTPQVTGNVTVKNGTNNLNTSITGTTDTYQGVNNVKIADGRFINLFDIDGRQKVAILRQLY